MQWEGILSRKILIKSDCSTLVIKYTGVSSGWLGGLSNIKLVEFQREWMKSKRGLIFFNEISFESYQDIKFPKLGSDEICQRSSGGRVRHIRLMKKHMIRESRVFEFLKSFETPLLISSCQHHNDPIWSQLSNCFKSNPLICPCNNCKPDHNNNNNNVPMQKRRRGRWIYVIYINLL